MYYGNTPLNFSFTSDPAPIAFLTLTEVQGKPFLFRPGVV